MARDFDGVDDKITPSSSAIFSIASDVLIAMILRVDVLGDEYLFHVGDAAYTRGVGIFINSLGTIAFDKPGDFDLGTATTALTAGIWYAIMVHSSSGADTVLRRLTLGSGTMASETVTSTKVITAAAAADPVTIGAFADGTFLFNGQMATTAIWRRKAFTEAEFRAWALGAWDSHLGHPLGFWPLLGMSSSEPDWSRYNNRAIVTGPVYAHHPPQLGLRLSPPRRRDRRFAPTRRGVAGIQQAGELVGGGAGMAERRITQSGAAYHSDWLG